MMLMDLQRVHLIESAPVNPSGSILNNSFAQVAHLISSCLIGRLTS